MNVIASGNHCVIIVINGDGTASTFGATAWSTSQPTGEGVIAAIIREAEALEHKRDAALPKESHELHCNPQRDQVATPLAPVARGFFLASRYATHGRCRFK